MTTDPHSIYLSARQQGLNLKADGERLLVWPRAKVTAEFQATLKANKLALLAWLRGGDEHWKDRPKPNMALPKDFFRTYPAGRPAVGITNDLRCVRPTPDRGGTVAQWRAVAGQVNAGEFGGANASTCESLFIGLRSLAAHPAAREALRLLAKEKACPGDVRDKIAKLK